MKLSLKKRQDIVICKANFYKGEPFYLVMFDNLNNTKKFITFLTRKKKMEKNLPYVKDALEDLLSVEISDPLIYMDTIDVKIKDQYEEETYITNIYYLDIEVNEALTKKVFSLDGKLFFWVRKEELENDPDFIAYNKEVFYYLMEHIIREIPQRKEKITEDVSADSKDDAEVIDEVEEASDAEVSEETENVLPLEEDINLEKGECK